jgi:hypothetical protein
MVLSFHDPNYDLHFFFFSSFFLFFDVICYILSLFCYDIIAYSIHNNIHHNIYIIYYTIVIHTSCWSVVRLARTRETMRQTDS